MFELTIDYVDKTMSPLKSRMIEISKQKGTRFVFYDITELF